MNRKNGGFVQTGGPEHCQLVEANAISGLKQTSLDFFKQQASNGHDDKDVLLASKE
jgi:hypothetical protein